MIQHFSYLTTFFLENSSFFLDSIRTISDIANNLGAEFKRIVKKITLEPSPQLREKIKRAAGRVPVKPKGLAKEILESALTSPEDYFSPLKDDWEEDIGREMVIPISDAKKDALKRLAKDREVSLKSFCLHILKRYFEVQRPKRP